MKKNVSRYNIMAHWCVFNRCWTRLELCFDKAHYKDHLIAFFFVFFIDLLIIREEYPQPRPFNPNFYFVLMLGCHHFVLMGDEQHFEAKVQSNTAAAEAENLSITPLTPCKLLPFLKSVMFNEHLQMSSWLSAWQNRTRGK